MPHNKALGIVSLVVLVVIAAPACLARPAKLVPERELEDRQLQALLDLFKSTGGNNWVNNSGWTSNNNDPCGRNAGNSPWYLTLTTNICRNCDLKW